MKSIAIKKKEKANRFISTKLRSLLREAKLKGKLRSIKLLKRSKIKVIIKIVRMTMGKGITSMTTIISIEAMIIIIKKVMIISMMITAMIIMTMTTARNNISTVQIAVIQNRNLHKKMKIMQPPALMSLTTIIKNIITTMIMDITAIKVYP